MNERDDSSGYTNIVMDAARQDGEYRAYSEYRIDFAKNLAIVYDEVWSSLIHSDNTINLKRKFNFDNMDDFLLAWKEIRVLKGASADIEKMTILLSTFPDLSIYLSTLKEVTGDECE
tara:strand:+ start:600 stop:950 length:351 start_codon:yes stop_codon:yes gene_type:complete